MLRELLSQHAPKFNTRSNLILVSTDEFAREKEKVKLEVQMPSFLVFSLLSTSMVVKASNVWSCQGQTEGNDDLNLNKQNFGEDLHSVHLTELQKLQQLWHRPSFKC